MILPKSNSKKYIKTIIGIYILYTIISPAIAFATGNELKIDYKEYEKYLGDVQEYKTLEKNLEKTKNSSITNAYENELKKQINNDIEELGFSVSNITLYLNLETGNISDLNLTIRKKENFTEANSITIEKIEIGNEKNNELTRQEIILKKEEIREK